MSEDGNGMAMSPATFAEQVAIARQAREALGLAAQPFDIAVLGVSDGGRTETSVVFGEAGATWWLESLSPMRGSLDDLEAVVRVGPPR
jgi:hypothetical protein